MSAVIIQRVDETHVYLNEDGNIVIRQFDPFEGGDSVVVIPVSCAHKIIDAILALCEE